MNRFPLAVLSLLAVVAARAAEPVPPDHAVRMTASQKLFAEKVRPFLTAQCLDCHGGAKTKAGFSLATRETLLTGGDRGPAVLPGKAKESLLISLVSRTDEPHMPPKKAAPPEAIEFLTKWIDLGAAYDKPLVEGVAAAGPKKPMTVTDKDRDYWAYRPLRPTNLPAVKDATWARTPIDRFILAKLDAAGIQPAPDAEKRVLIRRVTFDLTGLPPTPEEVTAFLTDPSANAYEKVVDRLLASPAFGERWARHWLDVARFGESHGFEHDYFRPHAYHYRDFVVRAMNADMPYDQFVKWQVAGDEFAPENPDALAATGFLGAGVYPTQITTSEAERIRYDAMDDMLSTTGHAVLALTVGCARCHDHKYDPIPTRDYYRMLAAFTTTVRAEVEVDLGTPEEKAAFRAWEARKRESGAVATAAAAVVSQDWAKPKDTRTKVQATTEGKQPMRHHTATGDIPDFYKTTFVLKRGDAGQKDGVADPGVLQVLTRAPDGERHWTVTPPPGAGTSHRRTALANWMLDTDAGAGALAARVIVNRLWHFHFGRGIVSTLNDFGFQGDPPTHPELLEFLAADLAANGWTLKRLHKQMVMSRVYQLAGATTPSGQKLDPDNRLWWHRPRRRLEAEAIRDSLLAVGASLDRTMFGPGTLDAGMKRRSLYFTVQRSQLIPMLQVFDWPDTLTSAAARPTTVVAPQALLFLNNPHVRGYAAGFAARLKAADGLPAKVDLAYRTAFGRPPTKPETDAGVAYLTTRGGETGLADYALVLMSLNEFLYVD
ncbi:MAG: PSD1 and planctomycete cytochrome C domain-containing protein [Fimbriiglobus sp.]